MLTIALGSLALSLLLAPLTSIAEEAAPEKKLTKAKEKYDADKDGQLNDEEKARAKADAVAKAKHTKEENLAKYDANKDGKLDEAEKAVKKADKEAMKAAKKAARAEEEK